MKISQFYAKVRAAESAFGARGTNRVAVLRASLGCLLVMGIACGGEPRTHRPAPEVDAAVMDAAATDLDSGTQRDASAPEVDAALDVDGSLAADANVDADASFAMDASADADTPIAMIDAAAEEPDSGEDVDAGACDRSFDLAFNTPDPTRDRFDPDEVYVLGTLSEGACYRNAFGHWSEPNLPLVGFECTHSAQYAVRPTDGRLLYIDTESNTLREFACDGCTYAHPQDLYPAFAELNDPVIPTPPCDADARLRNFLVSPGGAVIHTCEEPRRWYDAAGALVLDGQFASCFGAAGQLLLEDRVRSMRTGAEHVLVGLPEGTRLACRALEDGFWLALRPNADPDAVELWQIELDGGAQWLGAYSALPVADEDRFDRGTQLDVLGRLYQIIRGPAPSFDLIVRRSIDAPSEVLYDEQIAPTLRLHISELVSGPGPAARRPMGRVWGGEITEPLCLAPTQRWRYARSEPPPVVPLLLLAGGAPGPGLRCGTTTCEAGAACCETFDSEDWSAIPTDWSILESWKCSENPNDFENFDNRCSFTDAISLCDEAADCADHPSSPDDPAVCCFTRGGHQRGRECTTASACASGAATMYGYTNRPGYMAMIACQSNADCALAGPTARCVWDAQVTGPTRSWVGRCDAPIRAPDGTRLLASSVTCGATECQRMDDQLCCQQSVLPTSEIDPLSLPAPTCTRWCLDSSHPSFTAYSRCDEPNDCANPSQDNPDDPVECCMIQHFPDEPWDRDCRVRSECRIYACKTDADCARIDSKLRCRPERTLTGAGIARPDVHTCQTP